MENMRSERKCQHPQKVYATHAPAARLSDPPIMEVPYICADCGAEGVDMRSAGREPSAYDILKAKKARGGFGQ